MKPPKTSPVQTFERLTLEPIRTPEELAAVQRLAADDGHVTLYPTHLVRRGETVVGYISLFGTPMVHLWMDTKAATARDAVTGLQLLDTLAADRTANGYLIPVPKTSPFVPMMEKLGFTPLAGEYIWYVRNPRTLKGEQ